MSFLHRPKSRHGAIRPLLLLFAVVSAVVLALSMTGTALANTTTDKEAYQLGDTANISGTGMAAGESVTVDIVDANGAVMQTHIVNADGSGGFTDSWQIPTQLPPGTTGDFAVKAVGATSGLQDPPVHVHCTSPEVCRGPGISVGNVSAPVPASTSCTTAVAWHYVINQLNGSGPGGSYHDVTAPLTITATYVTAGAVPVAMDSNKVVTDAEVGYTDSAHLADTLIGATATLSDGTVVGSASHWLGNFVLSDTGCAGPGGGVTPSSSMLTEIHEDGGHTGAVIFNLGAIVHDKATVTFTPSTGTTLPANSTVDFVLLRDTDTSCATLPGTTTAASHLGVAIAGTSPAVVDPSSSPGDGPLHAGSYGYVVTFNSGDTSVVPSAGPMCEPFTVNKGDSKTETQIHLSGPPDIVLVGNPTTSAVVHDKATVSAALGVYNGFSKDNNVNVTFSFYTGGNCTTGTLVVDNPLDAIALDGSGVAHPSKNRGPLADGSYAFIASYPGNADYNGSTSACEPFTVVSSITDFHYHWYATNGGIPTGSGATYTCSSAAVLLCEATTDAADVPLAVNTGAKNKALTNTDTFLVHVTASNNTGVTKDVKIQGGLAAQALYFQSTAGPTVPGVQILASGAGSVVLTGTTGGSATMSISKTGNVITWIINDMVQGASFDLWVYVQKGYTTPGLQAVTSSWSQVDCGSGTVSSDAYSLASVSALGEAMPGCMKSKYTGDLEADVNNTIAG